MVRRVKIPKVVLALVAFAVGAAACGGSEDGETAVVPQATATSPATSAAPAAPALTDPPTTAVNPSTTQAPETAPTTAAPSTTQPPLVSTTLVDGFAITIGDLFFRPSSTSITVGDTVVWQHEGDFPHTTTAGTPSARTQLWHSGTMSTGDTFSMTFDTSGTFQYFCSIHPNDMQATITVTDG